MAEDNPKGTATAIAIAEVKNVPFSSGQMPKWASANSGVHRVSRKNWAKDTSWKKPKVSWKMIQTIPKVVATDTKAQANKTALIIFSGTSSEDFLSKESSAAKRESSKELGVRVMSLRFPP